LCSLDADGSCYPLPSNFHSVGQTNTLTERRLIKIAHLSWPHNQNLTEQKPIGIHWQRAPYRKLNKSINQWQTVQTMNAASQD
jgi:hypothetical protein